MTRDTGPSSSATATATGPADDLRERLAAERRVARRLEMLVEVARLDPDVDEATTARRLIDRLVAATGAATGFVGLEVDGRLRTLADTGAAESLPRLVGRRVSDFRAWQRFVAGEGAFLQRYTDGEASDASLGEPRAAGYTGYAAFPIRTRGAPTGAVALFFDRPVDELELDERVLEAIGRLVSVVFDNLRLQNELETRFAGERRYADLLGALQSLTRLGDEESDFEVVGARIATLIRDTVGAAAASVALVDDPDLPVRILASLDVHPAITEYAESRPARVLTSIGRFLGGSNSYVVPYEEGSVTPASLAAGRAAGYEAYAAIPIVIGDRVEGSLVAYFDRPVDSSALDVRSLDAIGRTASVAIENIRLRERLTASERRYRTLFEDSPEPYLVEDFDGRVLDLNRAAVALLGSSREDLVGRPIDELVGRGIEDAAGSESAETERQAGTDGPAAPHEAGRRPVRAGRPRRTTGHRTDGTTFVALVHEAVVQLDGEERLLVHVRDATEQDRLQSELVQAQKMEAIGLLVAGVAHELNNPLASIVAFSQLIRRDPRMPDDMKADADMLVGEADRTRRIVENLLNFARQRAPERHPTSLGPLIRSVLDLQAYSLRAGQITLDVDVPDDLPMVELDRPQIQQVLLNITVNAVQAIRASGVGGTIRIEARRVDGSDPERVRIAVEDDGPGVPPANRDRLFIPFFTTKAPGEGTGLGLPVSFGIVAAHGGQLWFEPAPSDRGSRFVLELPVRGVDEGDVGRTLPMGDAGVLAASASAATMPAVGVTDARGGPTAFNGQDHVDSAVADRPVVLVLDDEPAIRLLLQRTLTAAGCRPVAAATGSDAIELVRQQAFDAMLCDHRMAGMTGTEVFEQVVELRPELAERFVFMSGDVLNPELREFATARGLHLLAKPFDIEAVGRVMRTLGVVA